MNIDAFLTKDVLMKMIDNSVFSGKHVECPDCQCIDDDQYTCTSCWGQGGNVKISLESLFKAAYEIKLLGKEDPFWSFDYVKALLSDSKESVFVERCDFENDGVSSAFGDEDYLIISVSDIFNSAFK